MSYPRFLRVNRITLPAMLVAGLAAVAPATAATSSRQTSAKSGGAGLGSSSSAGSTTSVTTFSTRLQTRRSKRVAARISSRRTTRKPAAKRASAGDSNHLGDRTLREGMSGHDVRVLQAYLTLAGFPTDVDGGFGPGTQKNVEAFESAQGLPADGVVSRSVELSLRKVVAAIEADPPAQSTRINSDGTATAPAGAPSVVQQVVAAANQIIDTNYKYGGGHGSFQDSGYDCSGSVSYALHGGGLLSSPEDSTDLESYGSPGPGHWITIYANSGHTWMVVAGRAFNTANFGGPNIPAGTGPRWRANPTGNLNDGTGGYVVRHPTGL